jgi:toxin ParE1/3/4
MAARLTWLPLAEADLRDSLTYIAADNPSAAAAFGASIIDRIALLGDFPEMGRVIPELFQPDIREIVHRNYRIVYRFSAKNSKIEIVRIWHAARGTPELM